MLKGVQKNIRTPLNDIIKIAVPCVCLVAGTFVNLTSMIQKITGILGLFSYMNDSGNYTDTSNIGVVILVLFAIYVYLIFRGKIKCESPNNESVVDKVLCGNMMYFSIMFLTAKLKWGNRLGYYYLFTVPMMISWIYATLPIKKNDKFLRYLFITFLYVGYIIVMLNILGKDGYS